MARDLLVRARRSCCKEGVCSILRDEINTLGSLRYTVMVSDLKEGF